MPPEFPGWQSHDDSFAFFEKLGWTQAPLVPEFSPADFCAAFQARMGTPGMQFIDRSAEVPLGPNASHRVLPLAISELVAETQAFPERVVLIVRTAHNTPAFLGGLWYWIVTERGSVSAARTYLERLGNQTAAMIVVREGSFELMPTHVMMGPVRKAAGMATALVKRNPDEFLCCVCNKSFLAYEGTRAGLTHAFAGKCGHPYHIECLLDHIDLFAASATCATRCCRRTSCPTAGAPTALCSSARCGGADWPAAQGLRIILHAAAQGATAKQRGASSPQRRAVTRGVTAVIA